MAARAAVTWLSPSKHIISPDAEDLDTLIDTLLADDPASHQAKFVRGKPEDLDSLIQDLRELEAHLLRGKPEDVSFVKNFKPQTEKIFIYKTPDKIKKLLNENPYNMEVRLLRASPSDLVPFIIKHHPTHLGARAIRQAPEDIEWLARLRYHELLGYHELLASAAGKKPEASS